MQLCILKAKTSIFNVKWWSLVAGLWVIFSFSLFVVFSTMNKYYFNKQEKQFKKNKLSESNSY